CRHPRLDVPQIDRSETVAAILVDIVQRQLEVSAGLPCDTPFRAVTFGSV
ncbi:MAG: hypothetical protein HGA19_13600, partial [Oscillochloris sp.]|nr:hypothetical protein [Oscillochloris sp.]